MEDSGGGIAHEQRQVIEPIRTSRRPKRPMSAFLLWLCSARSQLKAENPGLRVTQIAKKGGEIWRNLPDKSTWKEKANRLREQYLRDLEAYKERFGGEERATQRRVRHVRCCVSSSSCTDDDSD